MSGIETARDERLRYDGQDEGLHDGPCELQDGYGDDGQEVRCVLCLAAERDERAHARRRDDPLRLAEWRVILEQAEGRQPCPDCGGSGTVAVHVCRDERECARKCLRVEPCMSCLGTGERAS